MFGGPIGLALTRIEFPDGETIIACANKFTLLWEWSNSLFCETQMEDNGILMKWAMDVRHYL